MDRIIYTIYSQPLKVAWIFIGSRLLGVYTGYVGRNRKMSLSKAIEQRCAWVVGSGEVGTFKGGGSRALGRYIIAVNWMTMLTRTLGGGTHGSFSDRFLGTLRDLAPTSRVDCKTE